MKNLRFDELKDFSNNDVLNFLNTVYNSESLYVVEQLVTIPFSVENLFSFNVYVPATSIFEIKELKIHIFEMIWRHKKYFHLKQIHPKTDSRFINEPWSNLFLKDPRSAAIVAPNDLLNMMKFAARLSRIKVFE